MDKRPRQAGETLCPARGSWLPEEGNEKGVQVSRPALLPAAVRTCGNGLFPTRPDGRPPAAGDG